MPHSSTVLSQMLKMMPRHEFEKLANKVDGKVRSTALSRWSQFVALAVGQLSGRQSLRDIENKGFDPFKEIRSFDDYRFPAPVAPPPHYPQLSH